MKLTLLPLGGLGEVGMNCMALRLSSGDLYVIDAGVTFPGRTHGIDLEYPALDWILAREPELRAILLTHGHEDHIGAIPFLLRALRHPPPIYGPPYALALVRRRLEEHGIEQPVMIATRPGERFEVGPVEVEPVRVNHSIPDCTSLILRTPAGTVVHSGDFKIEDRPLDGEAFGADALRRAGDEGVDLLLSDSTNIDVEGDSGEEADVGTALGELMAQATGRFVVAQFASNVYRMKATFAAARALGRRVALLGRSVKTHAEVARELRILDEVADLIVPDTDLHAVPRHELCVIATGTQGELPAALGRLARRAHPQLNLDPGDTVVLSARIIPGSEKAVFDMVDALERQGVQVLHRKNTPAVHCSGHAARDEQRTYLELVRPRNFVPVHGTFHHLRRHAELAQQTGVQHTLVIENGTLVELEGGVARVAGKIPTGRVPVDRGDPVGPEQLRDRRLIGELGHAVVAFAVDRRGRPVGHAEVVARGVVPENVEDEILDAAADYVTRALRRSHTSDIDALETDARRALKRFFGKNLRRRPIITALALEI